MDEDWSNGDFRVGEMFPDPHNRDCRKHQAKNRGRKCGTCMYCKCKATQVCPVCGDRWYMELRKRALRAHCRARGLRTPNGLTKQQLLDRLEVLNGSERPQPASAKTYKTTDEQRSKFQIGLHHDMLKHLRTYDSAGWSTAEELRFQFSVAVTLVHELTHVFWFNATERCWNCFDEDPYWHRNEDNFGEPKEIGNSWEYWAFGSRVPVGVRLTPQGSTETTNNFQRCQWNYIWSTKQVGRSDHPVIDHDFVLPVEYIHSWFREATWQRIATNGREAGRPNYAQAVFLREEPCGVDAKGEYKDYECTLENYNLAQLVAQGGYNHPGAARLAYGTKFDNNTKIKKHKKALIAKRDLCTCAGQP
ncbi:hypothetical protein CC86DRAFT_367023 [Ophiobolus disseminans]|uniref:Uncharacterized protein n=1 Tax=Ophiobolus disseminans TaxID=1469910 RepID=A0A6A7AEJ2_9PLEO|nr:hypothetical protein CC86DRAFT_367023 [Ophiobolus disseminans]